VTGIALFLLSAAHAVDAAQSEEAAAAVVGSPGPDRSARPQVVAPSPMTYAEPEIRRLTDAIQVQYVRVEGARKVEVHVLHHRGGLDLPEPGERPETLSAADQATGWLQDMATEAYPAQRLSETKSLHDVELTSWLGYRSSGVDLAVPAEELALGLELLGETLREPSFPAKEVRRYRRDMLRFYYYEGPTQPASVAANALSFSWYTPDHPYGARPDLEAWSHVSRADVLARHDRILREAPVTVLVVGDVDPDEVNPMLARFLDMGSPGVQNAEPPLVPPGGQQRLAVDMPGTAQALLRLRTNAPLQPDVDRPTLRVLDFCLGGSFLSRLNKNLREDKGWTYGVSSTYGSNRVRGQWTVSVDVPLQHAAEAVREIEAELDRVVASGLTVEEISGARNSFVSGWNLAMLNAASAAAFYDDRLQAQETVVEARSRVDALAAVTPEETRRVAAAWLAADRARTWVVVGDRAGLEPELASLGWAVTWITATEAIQGEW
jgi:zinc protease